MGRINRMATNIRVKTFVGEDEEDLNRQLKEWQNEQGNLEIIDATLSDRTIQLVYLEGWTKEEKRKNLDPLEKSARRLSKMRDWGED